MKLTTALPVFLLILSTSVLAEVTLTQSEISGKWSIDAESIHRDGSDSKPLKTTWTFRNDGTLIGESVDSQRHARIGKFRATLKYSIENGKLIKQASPGRSKKETCTAIEKDGNKMILKCTSVYFFMTKL